MWKGLTRKQLRDVCTFCLGAAGFLHELFLSAVERPFILTASLALMGFPFVLSAESSLRKKDDR